MTNKVNNNEQKYPNEVVDRRIAEHLAFSTSEGQINTSLSSAYENKIKGGRN